MVCFLFRMQAIPLLLHKIQGNIKKGHRMSNDAHIIDKFEHWSLADCACEGCLHFPGQRQAPNIRRHNPSFARCLYEVYTAPTDT